MGLTRYFVKMKYKDYSLGLKALELFDYISRAYVQEMKDIRSGLNFRQVPIFVLQRGNVASLSTGNTDTGRDFRIVFTVSQQ